MYIITNFEIGFDSAERKIKVDGADCTWQIEIVNPIKSPRDG